MEFKKFIENNWDVFLIHVCQYHSLEFGFLEEYEYELDWNLISMNREIKWNEEILRRFENKFLWHELAWNESIVWESSLINQFKKRLDWYYLGRNVNLPITANFVEEHKKKIFIIATNRYLTEELKLQYGKELLPGIKPKKASITKLTKAQLSNLEETIISEKGLMSNTYHNLYKEYILPNLRKQSIEEVFKNKFDYTQRYFRIKPMKNDIHGLTPEFKLNGKNIFGNYREGRGLFKISDELELINGSLQEGPPRLYEVPRFSDMSHYPVLLLSENIKSILQQFLISTHKFVQVKLSPKKIKTDLKFFILQIDYDSLLKQANFADLRFQKMTKNDWFGNFQKEQLEKGDIKNYSSINTRIKKLKSQNVLYSKFVPMKYEINTNEDIFTIEHDIIVNEFVKKAIESKIPNHVQFESVQLLNIRIPTENYNTKESRKITSQYLIVDSTPEISEEFIFYSDKARRLDKNDELLKSKIMDDEFYQTQKYLNVIIPESFKIKYRKNQIDKEEYEFLPIQDFYIQNEYSDRVPETYKSIIVAENGCGDALGLILIKDDDHKLRDELFEFNHETGEVEEY